MSTEITTAMVRQFAMGIALLQQQMERRLATRVRLETITNGEALELDQVDSVSMADLLVRHQDTALISVPHRRRVVQPVAASVADLIDRADLRRVINNPQNSYVQSFASASNRKHDDRIAGAFFATSVTGKGGSSTQAFDTTNYQIVNGGVGLTVAKLRTAASMLKAAENPKDDGPNSWHIAYSADKQLDLLGTTEVTSADFNTVRALVSGEISEFLGFEHVHFERMPVVAGPLERVAAWRRASMCLAVSENGRASIAVRPDKEDSIQVRYENDSGATRMDEKGVIDIQCA